MLTNKTVMKSLSEPYDSINITLNVEYCFRNRIYECCRPVVVTYDDNDNNQAVLHYCNGSILIIFQKGHTYMYVVFIITSPCANEPSFLWLSI